MKLRLDFVTNSSSSSFLLARKGELTEKQKKAILNYIENAVLGYEILAAGASDEKIQQVIKKNHIDYDDAEEIKKALKKGKSIYMGVVDFEVDSYADLCQSIWEHLEELDDGNFEIINGELEY